jgi:hypothetical protein
MLLRELTSEQRERMEELLARPGRKGRRDDHRAGLNGEH